MSLTINIYYTGKQGSMLCIAELREKYDLHMRVERFNSDESDASSDQKYTKQ